MVGAAGSGVHAFRSAVGIALLLLSSAAWPSAADDAFQKLAAQFIDDLPEFSQVHATSIGDHRYDHVLDDVDTDARSRKLALYKKYRRALRAVDREELSRANRVDAELLRAEIDSSIWSIETLQEWAWNPLIYVDVAGSSLYTLMARDFAPLDERVADIAQGSNSSRGSFARRGVPCSLSVCRRSTRKRHSSRTRASIRLSKT